MLGGAEVNGYTILKYKRKLYTGELILDKDITVIKLFISVNNFYSKVFFNKPGVLNMVFAWHPSDPVTGVNDWLNHGTTNRYTAAVEILK